MSLRMVRTSPEVPLHMVAISAVGPQGVVRLAGSDVRTGRILQRSPDRQACGEDGGYSIGYGLRIPC